MWSCDAVMCMLIWMLLDVDACALYAGGVSCVLGVPRAWRALLRFVSRAYRVCGVVWLVSVPFFNPPLQMCMQCTLTN